MAAILVLKVNYTINTEKDIINGFFNPKALNINHLHLFVLLFLGYLDVRDHAIWPPNVTSLVNPRNIMREASYNSLLFTVYMYSENYTILLGQFSCITNYFQNQRLQ